MVQCPRCDGTAPSEARFCPHCGTKLPAPEISPSAAVLVVASSFIAVTFGIPLLYATGLPLTIPMITATGEAMFLLIPLIYMLRRKVNVSRYVMLGSSRHVGLGLVLGVCVLGVSFALDVILAYFLGPSTRVGEANQAIISLARESPAAVMLLVILAGVCEEFAFRGFLQNALRRRYSLVVALLGASLAFGIAHFDPQGTYMIATFVAGLFFGYFYDRYRSYILSATAHATYNVITLAILVLAG